MVGPLTGLLSFAFINGLLQNSDLLLGGETDCFALLLDVAAVAVGHRTVLAAPDQLQKLVASFAGLLQCSIVLVFQSQRLVPTSLGEVRPVAAGFDFSGKLDEFAVEDLELGLGQLDLMFKSLRGLSDNLLNRRRKEGSPRGLVDARIGMGRVQDEA